MSQTPDRYAVMGNPISHSKSPQIHQLFAEQTGQNLSYEALLVPHDGFIDAVNRFEKTGGRGLNVTVPFKQEAWTLIKQRSHRAQLAGAVNTIIFHQDGRREADNTDGVGLVHDLTSNHAVTLAGRNILVLGAGGAVRGVLAPLLECQAKRLVIANRTPSKAIELAKIFNHLGEVSGCGFDEIDGQFDVVINGTAASLEGQVPPIKSEVLASHACCYDMMYSTQTTAFQAWAQTHHAALALDGLGMLVEQAAEAFYLWRGIRPSTNKIIELLRRAN